MRAWHVEEPGPVEGPGPIGGGGRPLVLRDTPVPEPGPGELLLRVRACGVCRTDLHVTEGDLPVRRPGVTPGHEVVGEVVAIGGEAAEASGDAAEASGDAAGAGGEAAGVGEAVGAAAGGFAVGDRAGAAWLRSTDGTCTYCRRGTENLCPGSRYTGWDFDGGYAEYLTVPAAFAHRLPCGYTDAELAPLLCAGIIGYRALKRAELPEGGKLGIYGFGGSAHLAAQVALARGATLYVMTRGDRSRELARSLGAAYVGGPADPPPEPLDAAILFAPAGNLVLPALAALDRGGTLAVAGIYLSDIPEMDYERYLFQERQLRSVTSNTREDAREFLNFAGTRHLSVTTHPYPLDAADTALADLKAGRFDGAAVLIP
ncbi:MAG: zinc-binding alcohol dehydrogenase family protein [Nocardiopsaceae bacterium]|nr:zinc-binding alcohol dehydrogenase family protein [Nocardiopsaceae bacterium]